MESACQTLAELRERFQRDLCLAINVSGIQLATGKLARQVQEVLERTGLPASTLELEITESVLMSDSQEALDCLAQLKRLGVQIAIDDFGTGYSSLSYIKRFAIDKLKIDRSFISDMEFSECDRQLVVTIINMAHDLSLQVIAEGIEEAWQLDYLRQTGCDQAQGYLISTPMTGAELSLWLEGQVPAQVRTAPTLKECEFRDDCE
jgi:EAL domain-containing protein (putative c-di-GMP-specific phosphodiesterase class I)